MLGAWLTDAGPLGAIIAFLLGGLIMLPIALCYAEVAGMYPVSGGEIAYIYKMYGERLSFLAGWLLAYLYIALASFEAISVGWVLSAMFPGTEGPTVYAFMGSEVKLWSLVIGLAIMGILTFVNFRGSRSTASVQNLFVFALVLAAMAFVLVGLFNSEPAHFAPMFVDDVPGGALLGITAVLATTPFWFSGFDTIPQAIGEVSDTVDLKNLPRVMFLAIAGATAFYILIILTASLSARRSILLSADLPLAAAAEAVFGNSVMRQVILFAGLCGLITTWNAVMYAATRVVYTLGRAHMIPHVFANVHPKFGSPPVAVFFVGIVGGLGALMGQRALLLIVGASSLAFSILFVLIIFGTILLRRRLPNHPRPYLFPGGLGGLSVVLVLALGVLSVAAVEPLIAAAGAFPPEWIMLGVWLAIGLVFSILAKRMRKKISKEEQEMLILK